MDKDTQKDFVKSLCDSIKLEVISKIEAGKVPEDWDGIELRQLLADKFDRETMNGSWQDKRNARRKDFENRCIVDNL